jgi:hypothetical protein
MPVEKRNRCPPAQTGLMETGKITTTIKTITASPHTNFFETVLFFNLSVCASFPKSLFGRREWNAT